MRLKLKNLPKESGWIQFNPDGVGYYIVLYLGEKTKYSRKSSYKKRKQGLWGNGGFFTW